MTALVVGLALTGGIVLAFLFGRASEYQKHLGAIARERTVRVADALAGTIVRIVGTLRPGAQTLRAPVSGRVCAHFDLQVWESAGEDGWKLVLREVSTTDFSVEDASGRAMVETSRFGAAVVLDAHWTSGTFNDATPALRQLLSRHGQKTTAFLGLNRSLRYREGALEPGERIAVVGRARWEDDPDAGAARPERGGYRSTGRKQRLVLEAHAEAVTASDDPQALR